MIADLIADGLQSGCEDLIEAAIPDICGHDMDVPESKLNKVGCSPGGTTNGLFSAGQAARMLTPGAAISGYTFQPRNSTKQEHFVKLPI